MVLVSVACWSLWVQIEIHTMSTQRGFSRPEPRHLAQGRLILFLVRLMGKAAVCGAIPARRRFFRRPGICGGA
jgi:hypothetical protein